MENGMVQGFSVEDTMTDDSYFNISETELSITSLFFISDTPKCDIIWTENRSMIFIPHANTSGGESASGRV